MLDMARQDAVPGLPGPASQGDPTIGPTRESAPSSLEGTVGWDVCLLFMDLFWWIRP
jgi:hypothetical protein